MTRVVFAILVSAVLIPSARAHEVRPAYLALSQTGAETYDVFWKVPARGEAFRLALYVRFPPDCVDVTEHRSFYANDAFTDQWAIRRPGGLARARIRIDGLTATFTDALVRVENLDGTCQMARLTPATPEFLVEASPSAARVSRTYLTLGVEHILAGIDHLLFVLALIIITRGGLKLVKTVTAFTISHTVTLTLAALGVVHVPPAPVEAVIALSIVFVAAEILRQRQGQEGITVRAPWVVAFTFGLLHGLGFAGALNEVGLPQTHIPTALLFFSIGVETGHFLFIGAAVTVLAWLRHSRRRLPEWSDLVPPYAIGSVAMFWVIERLW